jgi:hypothetical protein
MWSKQRTVLFRQDKGREGDVPSLISGAVMSPMSRTTGEMIGEQNTTVGLD